MTQVFCEAAEMLLRKDIGRVEDYTKDMSLKGELKKWRTQFIDAYPKARRAIEMLNENVLDLYKITPQNGMVNDGSHNKHISDSIRRDASAIVRLYMIVCNTSNGKSRTNEIESAIRKLADDQSNVLFSQQTIDSIRIN